LRRRAAGGNLPGVTLDQIIVSPVVGLLAVAGGCALVARLVGATGRFALTAVEAATSRALAETSLRHGDLTGMSERRALAVRARRRRRMSGLLALLWLALLVVPAAFSVVRPVYALASLLWLLPGRRVRFRMHVGRARSGSAVDTRREP
jgi:hypothetical protein